MLCMGGLLRRILLPALACSVVGLYLAAAANAAPGDLDPSFGRFGVAKVPGFDRTTGVATAGGQTYVAGSRNSNAVVARLLPSGQLDPAYGGDGYADLGELGSPEGLAVSPDGRAYVVGRHNSATSTLTAVLPSGAQDPAFGTGGSITLAPPSTDPAVDSQGRVVLISGGELQRLLPSGDLDPSFAFSGLSPAVNRLGTLDVGPDDSIYAVYDSRSDPNDTVAVKINESGSYALNWGMAGVAHDVIDNNGTIDAAAGPTGALSISAYLPNMLDPTVALTRLTPDGSTDSSFDPYVGLGDSVTPIPGLPIEVNSKDETLAAGVLDLGGFFPLAGGILSVSADADPSADFGEAGRSFVYLSGRPLDLTSITLGPSDAPVAGAVYGGPPSGGAVVRFLGSADTAPGDLDADGLRDSSDSCPLRAAKRHTGCPTMGRIKTIRITEAGRSRLVGTVRASPAACNHDATISLFAPKPRHDRKLSSKLVSDRGRWTFQTRIPQRFRLRVKNRSASGIGYCRPARTGIRRR